jgi:transcriptional regulator with GAF, ATPase, and Fis domain
VDESAVCAGGSVDMPAGRVAEALRTALTRSSPEAAAQEVIDMAVQSGPCGAASITVLGEDQELVTVAWSDDQTLKADQRQYQLGQGPGVDAVWTDGLFAVPDLRQDGRWPRWASAAAGLGMGAVLSVHLFTDHTLGSLNLYASDPRRYDHADLEAARVIAAHASVVLAYTRTERNLWRAIDTRNLIGQAQGILMERYRLTAAAAFEVLRRCSQRRNVKLVVLAEQLVTTGQLPDLPPPTSHLGVRAAPEKVR